MVFSQYLIQPLFAILVVANQLIFVKIDVPRWALVNIPSDELSQHKLPNI